MYLWMWPVVETGPRKVRLHDNERVHSLGTCHTEIKFKVKPCLHNEQSTHQNKQQLLKHGFNLGMWSRCSWKNTGWFRSKQTCWLEKAMAPHSSTLAWKIPWMEEPGKLQSMGSLRVGHDWATLLPLFTFMHWRRKWHPTHVFAWRIPGTGEPGGLLSMGSHRVGHDWSDLATADLLMESQLWFSLAVCLGGRPLRVSNKRFLSCQMRWPPSTSLGCV